jgi:serine/threonine protein phosphatase PrpC
MWLAWVRTPDSLAVVTHPSTTQQTRHADAGSGSSSKPRDEELDFFGITHPGKVRKDNQDHFLVSTLHKTARVRATSLPNPELFELPSQRIASFGMVADGVGGSSGGETASRAAVETIAEYVKETMNAFYTADEHNARAFLTALAEAAHATHAAVMERGRASGQPAAATTLTLYLAVWPSLYILHVGDSRFYLYRDGKLRQLTRDQTIAQDLVDAGAFPPDVAARSPLAHVLTSAIGGTAAMPEVSRTELRRGDALLLCTDGLTKHVSEDRIAERLRERTSAEHAARALVDDALADGGTDNVTVLVVAGARRR